MTSAGEYLLVLEKPKLKIEIPKKRLRSSIPFGVCVQLDNSFCTKWSVDHLAKFGFSILSVEIKLFKQSAVSVNNTQEDQMTNFAQCVTSNVDHNIRTLTRKETFHGMGIIAISFSKLKYDVIKRLKYNSKVDLSASSVKITVYDASSFNSSLKVCEPLITNNKCT